MVKQIEHTNRPYAFEAYSPLWSEEYKKIADEVSSVFNDNIVLLEHVGSTSIPGMSAKPQIDVLVTVKNFREVPKYYEIMKAEGYEPRGDYIHDGEEYFTKDSKNGDRLASVHVLPDGHPWAIDLLDFRDYLRSHPDAVARYAAVKQQMNSQYPADYTSYYKGKLATVHELRQEAADWRGHTLRPTT